MNPGGFIFFRPVAHQKASRSSIGQTLLIPNKLAKILLNKMVDNFGKQASLSGIFCRIFKNTRKRF
jgi:hypothetical protein